MDLWVRSQDKETILKVDYLYIPISRDKEHFGIYTKNGVRDEYLGIYKTKERALEVLDEIQNYLMPKRIIKKIDTSVELENAIHIFNPAYETIEQLNTYVYEMPED